MPFVGQNTQISALFGKLKKKRKGCALKLTAVWYVRVLSWGVYRVDLAQKIWTRDVISPMHCQCCPKIVAVL